MKYQYKCKEKNCVNLIGYNSFHYGKGRCKHCANLGKRNPSFNSKKQCGKNHWNYKHGNRCKYKKYYCIEKGCRRKVFYGGNRCKKHGDLKSSKTRVILFKTLFNGINNPNYKHGKYSYDRIKIYYCIDCNKKVIRPNTRCHSCNTKYRHKTTKFTLGNKNGNWKDGSSFEEYGKEFNNDLKEKIRLRDKYKCQLCGCSQVENGQQLDCHHIDYNKRNNNINNLVALCIKCHRKTNWNRKYSENKLKLIMGKIYVI